jgi:hypothetical protein
MGMQQVFNDILSMEGVKGLMLFSFAGDLVFKNLLQVGLANVEDWDWRLFIESLAGMREADLIFDKGRLYIRRNDMGYLVLLIGPFVPIAMIRLQCDIVLPSLTPAKKTKGIRRFFKKS